MHCILTRIQTKAARLMVTNFIELFFYKISLETNIWGKVKELKYPSVLVAMAAEGVSHMREISLSGTRRVKISDEI